MKCWIQCCTCNVIELPDAGKRMWTYVHSVQKVCLIYYRMYLFILHYSHGVSVFVLWTIWFCFSFFLLHFNLNEMRTQILTLRSRHSHIHMLCAFYIYKSKWVHLHPFRGFCCTKHISYVCAQGLANTFNIYIYVVAYALILLFCMPLCNALCCGYEQLYVADSIYYVSHSLNAKTTVFSHFSRSTLRAIVLCWFFLFCLKEKVH